MTYFYSALETVPRTVPARGERRRLDALIAQFKVLPEPEVLRTPDGQKRKHRARERKTGMFFQTASHLGYIKTTTLPPIFRVFLAKNSQPPPENCQISLLVPLHPKP